METEAQRGVSLTIEQMLAAFLEQTADVKWDEELGSKRIAIQVTGQRKGTLQNRDQQKATGGGFSMPTLYLVESTERNSITLNSVQTRENTAQGAKLPGWRHTG